VQPATTPSRRSQASLSPEKEFYLRHFRHRSILFHVSDASDSARVRAVMDELAANETLTVAVVPAAVGRGQATVPLRSSELSRIGSGLVELSARLLRGGSVWVEPAGATSMMLKFSVKLALRLGTPKLVVVDGRGGLREGDAVQSFVKLSALAKACGRGDALSGWTATEFRLLRRAIRDGVESVNLTSGVGLAAELFSYAGSGTLITAGDYATVEPLRVDDFPPALELLRRGEQEGFLLRRTARARARLLLNAYGAWFEGRRLAGIAGLEMDQYRPWKLGEVVGLYTITRFQGEGVGVRILAELANVARASGCRAIFACTSERRAATFFERNGFVRVAPDLVPEVKWRGRPGARPTVFWCDL
jgi:N-acetylglutamate synthase-like GNAT family acetyltransferase